LRRTPGQTIADARLDTHIKDGLAAVLARYQEGVRGWSIDGSSGADDNVSMLYLLILTEANQAGFTFAASHIAFQQSLTDWISLMEDQSTRRKIVSNTSLLQEFLPAPDSAPVPERTYQASAHIVWYPWNLLLSRQLQSDSVLTSDQAAQARSIYNRLLPRLPEAIRAVNSGDTFLSAEMLYAVGHLATNL
jgi:hypothetical protein